MGSNTSLFKTLTIIKIKPNSIAAKYNLLPFVHHIYSINNKEIKNLESAKQYLLENKTKIELVVLNLYKKKKQTIIIEKKEEEPLGISVKFNNKELFMLSLKVLEFKKGFEVNDYIIGIENSYHDSVDGFYGELFRRKCERIKFYVLNLGRQSIRCVETELEDKYNFLGVNVENEEVESAGFDLFFDSAEYSYIKKEEIKKEKEVIDDEVKKDEVIKEDEVKKEEKFIDEVKKEEEIIDEVNKNVKEMKISDDNINEQLSKNEISEQSIIQPIKNEDITNKEINENLTNTEITDDIINTEINEDIINTEDNQSKNENITLKKFIKTSQNNFNSINNKNISNLDNKSEEKLNLTKSSDKSTEIIENDKNSENLQLIPPKKMENPIIPENLTDQKNFYEESEKSNLNKFYSSKKVDNVDKIFNYSDGEIDIPIKNNKLSLNNKINNKINNTEVNNNFNEEYQINNKNNLNIEEDIQNDLENTQDQLNNTKSKLNNTKNNSEDVESNENENEKQKKLIEDEFEDSEFMLEDILSDDVSIEIKNNQNN